MRKRTPVVVVSSEEENEGEFRGRATSPGRGSSGPKSRSVSTARKRPRGQGSRKGKGAASALREAYPVAFDSLSEEFSEHLHNFSITPGVTHTEKKELWNEKHKPHSLAELAVHKKKVEEVKRWLEERMMRRKEGRNNCLLITGQSGVGKSTAIHVIASLLGAELCEWMTPTPTLWGENIHNSNSGLQYVSKLDEFESFVERIRKYSLLHPACFEEIRKPLILLIDDIPVTNGRVAFSRLRKCLETLTHSALVPTVILITQYHKIDSCDSAAGNWEELESFIEQAGAFKVVFNPITENSIKKRLTRICQEEKCNVPAELLHQIARFSGGDIRHAIISLQYSCLKKVESLPIQASTFNGSSCKLNSTNPVLLSISHSGYGQINSQISLPWGRDEKISLFHALGKFLHNKREETDALTLEPFVLKERYSRKPMKMDAPEKVVSQAHGEAQTVSDFLHENVLDFLSDEAIENASLIASYLSDADNILASMTHRRFHRITDTYEPDSIRQQIVASVAVRGVLFGNSCPSPSRWHAIRAPKLWQLEPSLGHNKVRMLLERFEAYSSFSCCSSASIATEFRPTSKWLCSKTSLCVNMHDDLSEIEDYSGGSDKSEVNKVEESEEDDIEEC
ncbi:cell cycle checkpoint protein RAD17-like isoform X2 [Zingiber officinale]|uniref:cell cycle checkpoint protein RAD17-like isoform X2 n=1 Tax=Zingiber officinale TaxID=94328 RepID=UPI001C4D444E|nr:cell cycle checkpoint protein RAD17-like isoform X2 [Zingiber officinale]